MKTQIIFDCEFICLEGSQRRYWCAPSDPDPVIAQIGAVKLGIEGDFPILDTFMAYVVPMDRFGAQSPLDPFFTKLTGITNEHIEAEGISLESALAKLDEFSGGACFWSWGKDELNMVAISCYVAGIEPPIGIDRFGNAAKLLLAAGMPMEDLARTPSNKLAEYYAVSHPPLRGHDARDDALSVAYTLQHLLREGRLKIGAFDA
ncbi:MAG: 3'-5' exonuclease, partial [Devosiaceae bacterium]